MTRELLHILQHTLGVDQYGRGRQYRNHFCAGGDDVALCEELSALGFMRRHATNEIFPGDNFSVTEAGRKAMVESSPEPPKLTRSQQRYHRFLNWADAYDGTFREFLAYERGKT
jgi:hypothetical protein